MFVRAARRATLALGVIAVLAGPARAVNVSVVPADTSVTVGDVVVLRIEVSALPDLKGTRLIHGFTASRLLFQGAAAGGAVRGSGSVFEQLLPDVASPVDSVAFDMARLDGSGSGPGVLAFYTFKTTATGDANVVCEFVDLRDSFNQPTLPACAGGVIHISGPVPVSAGTWGRVKVLYR
jgi:hypothetical protein